MCLVMIRVMPILLQFIISTPSLLIQECTWGMQNTTSTKRIVNISSYELQDAEKSASDAKGLAMQLFIRTV